MYTQLKEKATIAHSAQLVYDSTKQNQTYK